jgi:hypothetical protein
MSTITVNYVIEIKCDDDTWTTREYGNTCMNLEESKKFIATIRKVYPQHTFRLVECVTVKMVVNES